MSFAVVMYVGFKCMDEYNIGLFLRMDVTTNEFFGADVSL